MDDQIVLKLAEQLGIGIEKLTAIFIEAQIKVALIDALLFVGCIVGYIGVMLHIYHKKNTDDCRDIEETMIMYGSVVLLVLLLLIIVAVRPLLVAIVAPEYSGILELINRLSGR